MVLRQSLQNKYSYVHRKTTFMQIISFYLQSKQNGEDAFLFKPNYLWAYLCHPQEIVGQIFRQIFAQIVSLRQISNIIYHVYISNNKNKHFSP